MSDLLTITKESVKKEAKIAAIAGGVLGTLNAVGGMNTTTSATAALISGGLTTAATAYLIENETIRVDGFGLPENLSIGCCTFIATSVVGSIVGTVANPGGHSIDAPTSLENAWED